MAWSGFNGLIHSKNPLFKLIFRMYVKLSGSDIPSCCKIGKNVQFPHGIKGIIFSTNTIVEDNVTIYHQVTCGRGDIFPKSDSLPVKGIILKKGSILCAGAKIICNRELLVVGENTVIGANAVLTCSTGDNEIWGGIPAKKLKDRVM